MPKPREFTEEEVREKVINHIRILVNYWDKETRETDPRAKLEGLAFSILVMLDGETLNVPGFIVAPHPHKEDKEYCKTHNKNWFAQNHESDVKCDIGGCLHEYFFEKD